MKTTIKTAAVLVAVTLIMGGVAAFCEDTTSTNNAYNVWAVHPQNLTPAGKVMPTTTYFTNNQQTVVAIQTSRMQQQGGCPKGAMLIRPAGPDVQIRPNKAFQEQNPLVSDQHLWLPPPQSP
jgi:hypothetical protein